MRGRSPIYRMDRGRFRKKKSTRFHMLPKDWRKSVSIHGSSFIVIIILILLILSILNIYCSIQFLIWKDEIDKALAKAKRERYELATNREKYREVEPWRRKDIPMARKEEKMIKLQKRLKDLGLVKAKKGEQKEESWEWIKYDPMMHMMGIKTKEDLMKLRERFIYDEDSEEDDEEFKKRFNISKKEFAKRRKEFLRRRDLKKKPVKGKKESKKRKERASFLIRMCSHPPIIDGSLRDKCWQRAEKIANFLILGKKKKYAKIQTEVFLLYDEKYFYMGFECREPKITRIKATHRKRDSLLWEDDCCVEIFIDTNQDRSSYYHIAVNSLGTIFDEIVLDPSWNGTCNVATAKRSNFWTVELAIPFKTFGYQKVRKGMRWNINLCRRRLIRSKTSSTWAYLPTKNFNQPKWFKVVEFK